MERIDLPDEYNFFEIGYCGHPDFPYAHIQLEQATKWILSHFQEEDHPYIVNYHNRYTTVTRAGPNKGPHTNRKHHGINQPPYVVTAANG